MRIRYPIVALVALFVTMVIVQPQWWAVLLGGFTALLLSNLMERIPANKK